MKIRNRYSGEIEYEGDAPSLREFVEGLVKEGADLRGVDLRGADLRGVDLRGVDLHGVDLRGVDLHGVDLHGADLRGVDLHGVDLRGVDLHGADLRGVDLRGAFGVNPFRTTDLLMLPDQPGKIRAYKLVNEAGEGPIQGGITYKMGETFEVGNANTCVDVECGSGISLATLPWCMRRWEEGYKIFIVEFEAKDIAAIPTCTDGKFRVHRCTVAGEKDLKEIGLGKEEDHEEDSDERDHVSNDQG